MPYRTNWLDRIPCDPSAESACQQRYRCSTTLDTSAPAFANVDQRLSGTRLERELKIKEYSVSNRGLRPGQVGTAEQVTERTAAFEAAGIDLLRLQMSPQLEEMEMFARALIGPARR